MNFNWGEGQESISRLLKAHLMFAPILRLPNFIKIFYIETDALTVGLGAMLSQSYRDDIISYRLPVVYANRLLSDS